MYGSILSFWLVSPDARNDKALDDENSILSGNKVTSGEAFHTPEAYGDPAYVKEHPEIIVDTLDARRIYEIVAVYEVDVYEDDRSPFYDEDRWKQFASRVSEKNLLGNETF